MSRSLFSPFCFALNVNFFQQLMLIYFCLRYKRQHFWKDRVTSFRFNENQVFNYRMISIFVYSFADSLQRSWRYWVLEVQLLSCCQSRVWLFCLYVEITRVRKYWSNNRELWCTCWGWQTFCVPLLSNVQYMFAYVRFPFALLYMYRVAVVNTLLEQMVNTTAAQVMDDMTWMHFKRFT